MTRHTSKPKVLVTGAAGIIGSAFWRAEEDNYALLLADLHPQEGMLALDVTDHAACLAACRDIDVVVHLAGIARADADFHADLLQANIVGTYNIFEAAAAQGCRRVVYASSAQAVEGYPLDMQVHESMAARPANMYGASKAFGEAVAATYAVQRGLATVAVRIANVAEFQPGQQHSARDIAAFISVRDVVHLLACCIDAPLVGYHVVHGVSNNRYKRLAIDATRKLVAYRPQDDGFALLGL